MPKPIINDSNAQVFIKALANEFMGELALYKSRLDLSKYKQVTLEMRVTLGEKPEFELVFSPPGFGGAIKHVNLAELMAEAYRRANYSDKAEASIQRESDALLALPSPEEV